MSLHPLTSFAPGCKDFNLGFYVTNSTEAIEVERHCSSPLAQPATSIVYFVSFITVASFVILSMFVGGSVLGSSQIHSIRIIPDPFH
jgi:hypothetical protein